VRAIELGEPVQNPSTLVWARSRRCESSTCLEVAPTQDGGIALRDSSDPDGPILRVTRQDWDAFAGGILDGDFQFE
jgi:hypothetical protein